MLKQFYILVFSLYSCLSFGQINKFLDYKKKYVPLYGKEISSIYFLDDSVKFNRVIVENEKYQKSKQARVATSYVDSIRINFLKKATKIETDSGTIYTMHFAIEKGYSFSLTADTFEIPQTSYLVSTDINGKLDESYKGDMQLNKKGRLNVGVLFLKRKESILSIFFDKKTAIDKSKITFSFVRVNPHDKPISNMVSSMKSATTLTSSTLSTASCDNLEIGCMPGYCEVDSKWINEVNSVVQVEVQFDPVNGVATSNYGTAFFVNSTNYGSNRMVYPYLLSCAHIFYHYEDASGNEVPFEDWKNNIYDMFAWYGSVILDCPSGTAPDCSNNYIRLSLIESGNMSSKSDNINDYSLLQSKYYTMDQLMDKAAFSYAGFNSQPFDYATLGNLVPFRIFHYPLEGEYKQQIGPLGTKKYLVNNMCPADNGDYYLLLNDPAQVGYTHKGSSGAPLFDNDHQVIGMLITGNNTCDNPHGDENRVCKLSTVFQTNQNVAMRLGASAFTFDPLYKNLQPHCYNCVIDKKKGEIMEDCGGECAPCSDVQTESLAMATTSDLRMEAKTTKSITINGNGTPIVKNKDVMNYSASEGISITGEFSADNNLSFSSIDPLRIIDGREKRKLCNPSVTKAMSIGGSSDAIWCTSAYASGYSISIFLSNGVKLWSGSGNVYSNEPFKVYRGESNSKYPSGSVLYYTLNIVDNTGNTTTINSWFMVFKQ